MDAVYTGADAGQDEQTNYRDAAMFAFMAAARDLRAIGYTPYQLVGYLVDEFQPADQHADPAVDPFSGKAVA